MVGALFLSLEEVCDAFESILVMMRLHCDAPVTLLLSNTAVGTEIDVLSVRRSDAMNISHQYDSGRVAQITDNGRQRADVWMKRTLRNVPGPYHGILTGSKQ